MLRKRIVVGTTVWFAAALLLTVSTVSAQSPRGRGWFSGGPKVGDALPDVVAFDADGKEFSLKALRGHYSVLVFGCLT